MPKVFISHSSADQEVAHKFQGLIEALGYEVWIASKSIEFIKPWQPSLVSGLENTDWLLVLVSRSSAKSQWVAKETAWAIENLPGRVIPIVLDDAKPEEIDPRLAELQHVRLMGCLSGRFAKRGRSTPERLNRD
jgi:hypothetical protein